MAEKSKMHKVLSLYPAFGVLQTLSEEFGPSVEVGVSRKANQYCLYLIDEKGRKISRWYSSLQIQALLTSEKSFAKEFDRIISHFRVALDK